MRHQGGKAAAKGRADRGVKEETMAAQSYDRLDGVIWYDGKLVPWDDANLHVLSHGLHYASAVFEGERAYGGEIFKMHRAFRAAEALGQDPRFRDPLFGRRDRRRQEAGAGEERQEGSLCPPGRLARLGDDGRLGAEQHHPSRHRHAGNGRAISIPSSGSRASGSTSPTIAGPIRRPRRAAPRPPAST